MGVLELGLSSCEAVDDLCGRVVTAGHHTEAPRPGLPTPFSSGR
jgi:hypothetical protein